MKIIPNITFKSVLQPIKNIKKRNAYFDWLNDESKRLEIAWDCLQLVLSGKIVADDDRNFWSRSLIRIKTQSSKEFQRILNEELPECTVCARGGLMLSQIRLGNNILTNDDYRDCGKENIKGFTYNDFKAIESEFEYSTYKHPYEDNTDQKLANIMCNILVNGNFNIEDRTDYLTVIY